MFVLNLTARYNGKVVILFSKSTSMHWVYYFGRGLSRVILFTTSSWQVKGKENVPKQGHLIIVCNHLHVVDPPIVAVSIKLKTVIMAKDELFLHKWSRFWVQNFGTFPVRRRGVDREALRQAEHWLKQDVSLLTFPEGKSYEAKVIGQDARTDVALIKIEPEEALTALPMGDSDSAQPGEWVMAIGNPFGLGNSVSVGVVSFHGPSVMAGLAQAPSLPPQFLGDLRAVLFDAADSHDWRPYGAFADLYPPWGDPRNATAVKQLIRNDGPHWLQGARPARGRLMGGCIEVLEMLKGTPHWPGRERWNRSIVFLEGSEEQPPPVLYRRVLRSWAAAGLLDSVSGVMIGRAQGFDAAGKHELDQQMLTFARDELKRPDLVVVTNVDVGHTAPQWTVPIGGLVEIDPGTQKIRLLEPAVV